MSDSGKRRRRGSITAALSGLNDSNALFPGADAPGY